MNRLATVALLLGSVYPRLLFAQDSTTPTASTCTEEQVQQLIELNAENLRSSECADIDFTTYAVCESTECLGFLADVMAQMPDCLYRGLNYSMGSECVDYWAEQVSSIPDCSIHGINYRDTLSFTVTSCGATITEVYSTAGSAGSPTTDSTGSSSTNTDAATSSSGSVRGSTNAVSSILMEGYPLALALFLVTAIAFM